MSELVGTSPAIVVKPGTTGNCGVSGDCASSAHAQVTPTNYVSTAIHTVVSGTPLTVTIGTITSIGDNGALSVFTAAQVSAGVSTLSARLEVLADGQPLYTVNSTQPNTQGFLAPATLNASFAEFLGLAWPGTYTLAVRVTTLNANSVTVIGLSSLITNFTPITTADCFDQVYDFGVSQGGTNGFTVSLAPGTPETDLTANQLHITQFGSNLYAAGAAYFDAGGAALAGRIRLLMDGVEIARVDTTASPIDAVAIQKVLTRTQAIALGLNWFSTHTVYAEFSTQNANTITMRAPLRNAAAFDLASF